MEQLLTKSRWYNCRDSFNPDPFKAKSSTEKSCSIFLYVWTSSADISPKQKAIVFGNLLHFLSQPEALETPFFFFWRSVLQLGGHMANPLELGCGFHYSPSWCSGTSFLLLITEWAVRGNATRCPLGRRENKHMGMPVCISRGISARGKDKWLGWIVPNKHGSSQRFRSALKFKEVQP